MSISKFNTFPFLRRHYWKGETGSQLRFTSTNSTITPTLVVSGGPTPLWYVTESTGQVFKYEAASFSHTKTAGTGNLTVRLVNTEAIKNYVTQIELGVDGITTNFYALQIDKFVNRVRLWLYGNPNLYGDLTNFQIKNENNIAIYSTDLSGNIESWDITLLQYIQAYNCNFTGNLSLNWVIPAIMLLCKISDNNFTSGPRISVGSSALREYEIQNNGLTQSAVDQIVLDVYNNRANFTYATPTLNVGGTNAAPSGTYQDATPPTTGKEYIYKLVNDPDLEGFNKWTITYTA